MKKILAIVMLLTFAASSAMAANIRLGQPKYGGSGCRAGTASVALSPDRTQLSILFDEYLAEAGYNGRRLARKSCNIAIPVHVPQGFSVSIFKTDYRGFVSVPRGGMGRLNVEYFFAGQQGPRFSKYFRGGYDNEYLFRNKVGAAALVWSACGKDVILRTNSNLMIRSNRNLDDALGTVDSVDVDSGIIYHVKWKRCRR
jgi:hypothetical protein